MGGKRAKGKKQSFKAFEKTQLAHSKYDLLQKKILICCKFQT
jgi:hypothetical protein